jgi:hypothetical protein
MNARISQPGSEAPATTEGTAPVAVVSSASGIRFEHHAYPCDERFAEIERLPPFAPFNTLKHARARAALGDEPYVFVLRDGSGIIAACVGLVTRGRLTSRLYIPSFPKLDDPRPFGAGLERFCRAQGVWDLELGTFASLAATFPVLPAEVARRPRWEFTLDLSQELSLRSLATNHKRNAERARKGGVQIVITREPAAAAAHLELMNASMSRRQQRGEDVTTSRDARQIAAYLQAGCAEIFRAMKDDVVLSSILVLQSDRAAYYHSAGTTPEGMQLGASPFLITQVAARLRERGFTEFNLGGAEPENAGLWRFKSGFGAQVRNLEAVSFACASPFKRRVRSVLQAVRSDPRSLLDAVVRSESYVVYAADPRTITVPALAPGHVVREMTAEELQALAKDEDFGYSARKLGTLSAESAHGLWVDGKLAHLAWLVDAAQDARLPVRNAKLHEGEREITHCVTARAFRGKGLYPIAIAQLCGRAASVGAERVMMITGRDNTASQRGIEKAGFRREGAVLRVFSPRRPGWSLTWRGHRW